MNYNIFNSSFLPFRMSTSTLVVNLIAASTNKQQSLSIQELNVIDQLIIEWLRSKRDFPKV